MGSICGSPKDSAVETEPVGPKLTVLVVKVQGLPANNVPLDDRTLTFECEIGKSFASARMTNVIDPIFNEEFEAFAGILQFKLMEKVGDEDPKVVGEAELDCTEIETCYRDLKLNDSGATVTVKVKAEGNEYPPDAVRDYEVRVDNPKKTKTLGVELDTNDSRACFVTGIKANSLVDKHNKSADESQQISSGAYIVGFNGVSDSATNIQKAMVKAAPSADFTIRPMENFRIAVDKSQSDIVGIDVPKKPVGHSVLITQVKEGGIIAKWNDDNPTQKIEVMDRILEVNGKTGKGQDIVNMIKKAPKSTRVVLTISRMATPPE